MGSLIFGEFRVSQGGRQPSTDINLAWETNKDINVQICFTKFNGFSKGLKAFVNVLLGTYEGNEVAGFFVLSQ